MKKLFISTTLLAGVMVFAGGFRVSLQGVKQLAMAHTSAHAEDASVAFFNPAGISFIPSKLSVAAGAFAAMSKVTYQNLSTLESSSTNNPVGTPFYAGIAYKVTDNFSVGFSATTPFGSTIQYPEDWAGKEIVQKLSLKAFYFEPMVSVKLAPWASFGASYIYAKGSVDWDRAYTLLNGTINLQDSQAKGSGFGFGFYFQPDSKWDVSVAYRSPVDMKADNGTVTMNLPNVSAATAQALFAAAGLNANGQDSFSATLPLVEEYTIAATYKISPKWLISGDFNYSGWERYSKLALNFANFQANAGGANPTVLAVAKNWHDTATFRLGTQYMVKDWLAARIGWYYDQSPYYSNQFAPETPSFDAHVLTAGVGFKFNKLNVDIAMETSFPKTRNNISNDYYNFSGQVKANTYYFGLGL
jgi:long-chain fatty acid transport protein